MVFTRIDEAQRFFAGIGKMDAVGNDAAIEINVGLGIDSDVREAGHGNGDVIGYWEEEETQDGKTQDGKTRVKNKSQRLFS